MVCVIVVLVGVAICNPSQGQQAPLPEEIERSRIRVPGLPIPVRPTSTQLPPSRPAAGDVMLQTVEFVDAPLEDALRLFKEESKLKVVASPKAKTVPITATIKDMPASQALKELARQNNLFVRYDRNTEIYTIYKAGEIDTEAWDPDSLRQFEQEINEAFPDSFVQLKAVGKQLLVRGQAHDVVEASRIIQIIDAEAKTKKIKPENESTRTTTEVTQAGGLFGGMSFMQETEPQLAVIDMLTVTGEQQVSLRVTVAEVDRNAARQIGLNFGISGSGDSVFQSLSGTNNVNAALAAVGTAAVTGGNLPVSLDNGQIQLAITALRQMSLAKTLAEPTLTSLNGQEASFQAGGQFPIPVVSGQTVGGLQGVSFVPFGIDLQFTPYITDRDRIRLKVSAEVSSRTQSETNIGGSGSDGKGGTPVPGLDMRKFQTIVELREGQTLAVAGLISNNQVNRSDRVPFFGDLPLVGRLAALDRISMREQELVILVTPELVRALDPEERPSLPGTDIFEPGDIEFYLGAHMEGTRNEDFRSPARTDIHRQHNFYSERDVYIVGPHGYTQCGPQPGVFQ